MAKLNLLCDGCRRHHGFLNASAKPCPNDCGLRAYSTLHQCDVCSILTDTCESCGHALARKIPAAHKRRIRKALETCNRRKQAADAKFEAAIAPFKKEVETFEQDSRRSGEMHDKYVRQLRADFGLCDHQQNGPDNPDLKIGGGTVQQRLKILVDAFHEHNTRIQEAFSGLKRLIYDDARRIRHDEIRIAENYLAAVADFVIGIYNCHMEYKREVARIKENASKK